MNLGDFHARVATALGRGTSLDGVIPGYVEEAVQQIEENYTFQYMKRWVELSIDASATSPHIISLYATPVKKIELLRYVNEDDGRFVDLRKIEPKDRATREDGLPSGYWLDGLTSIVLDAVPEDDLELEGHFHCYSSWQSGETGFNHYLIDRKRNLLLSQTVLVAAVDLRDVRLSNIYGPINTQAWTRVNVSEEDIQYGGADMKMEYSPEYSEFDPNLAGST